MFDLKTIRTIKLLEETLQGYHKNNKTLGFVPTMGALHNGHMSLLQESIKKNDYTVCSIYVNPRQFNDKKDLLNYPRSEQKDIIKLQQINCNVVFIPSDKEVNMIRDVEYNFTNVVNILEGLKRPGHFLGVIAIIHKLFNIIQPHRAYFGEKDYQQFWIISMFKKAYNISVEIQSVPTVRDDSGLALSSRNQFLTNSQKIIANTLFNSMMKLKEMINVFREENPASFLDENNLKSFKKQVIKDYLSSALIKLDYFEIIETENFSFSHSINFNNNYRILIAAYIGKIRLIDNISLK